MKKKVVIAYLCAIALGLLAIWYGMSYAQDTKPQPAVEQATVAELQWKAMYLQEHIKALQADFRDTQDMLKQVQAELKARQSTPAPAPKESAKPQEKQ